MFQKQEFDNNIYMKIIRYIYILLMGNLCFVLASLPFSLAVLFLAVDVRNAVPFIFSTLFLGPALIALFAVFDELKETHDCEPIRVFLAAYRKLGLRGLLYWLIGWFGSIVAIADILFFLKLENGHWLTPFFLLLLLLTVAISLNAWYFQVRNPEKPLKDILRIAVYYALRKWYFSLLNVILFSLVPVLMVLKPQFGLTVTPAIFSGLIFLNAGLLHRKKLKTKQV